MLINLSNHHSDFWDGIQKQSVESRFGKIIDLPFPNIDPMADIEEVSNLANKYFQQCASHLVQHDGYPDVIHVTGEHTFTFTFVTLAKANGIKCVCSTTPRIVETTDGIKTSVFRFIQLRSY